MSRGVEVSLRVRGDLWERSEGHCEVAGEPLPSSFAVHHRKRRSQGGTNEVTNLMIVCHFHHNGGTYSIHAQPELSYRRGWLVHESDDPLLVPMQRFIRLDDLTGQYPFFYLTKDGLYIQQSPLVDALIKKETNSDRSYGDREDLRVVQPGEHHHHPL